ncbi:DNA/RNA nuclease SfsA [Tistrella mobilis]|uniref:DNA/RNA nuclease SfsA n=1 Tax=Tistrella mobilis TaxID=171437 RepID=UPI0035591F6D
MTDTLPEPTTDLPGPDLPGPDLPGLVFTPPLEPARLVRRYKRFLADIVFNDGNETTAHVANPGSMAGLADPGARIWLQRSADPKRKLPLSWVLVETAGGAHVVVDTGRANGLVAGVIRAGLVPGLGGPGTTLRREVRYGAASRVDLVVDPEAGSGALPVYVEVKSVTLSRKAGLGEFPDARTARGARHLVELATLAQSGAARAMLIYAVMRSDADRVDVATDIDPAYAAALDAARAAGVGVTALGFDATPRGISFAGLLPVAGSASGG